MILPALSDKSPDEASTMIPSNRLYTEKESACGDRYGVSISRSPINVGFGPSEALGVIHSLNKSSQGVFSICNWCTPYRQSLSLTHGNGRASCYGRTGL